MRQINYRGNESAQCAKLRLHVGFRGSSSGVTQKSRRRLMVLMRLKSRLSMESKAQTYILYSYETSSRCIGERGRVRKKSNCKVLIKFCFDLNCKVEKSFGLSRACCYAINVSLLLSASSLAFFSHIETYFGVNKQINRKLNIRLSMMSIDKR